MTMDGDAPFPPQDIISNILKRLPRKSLCRFQCVCRDWKILLKTPYFIKNHLHHSSHQNPILLFADRWENHILDFYSQVGEVQNAPWIHDIISMHSSNGLLCVETYEFDVSPRSLLLLNPAVREVKQVPRMNNDYKYYSFFGLGFGFSPILNDHKIVRLCLAEDAVEYEVGVYRVEVYSLRTGLWKEVKSHNLEGVEDVDSYGVTINGVMFWFGKDRFSIRGYYNLIVSFDLVKEEFTVIKIPDFDVCTSELVEYDDKLAVLSISNGIGGYKSRVELSVKEDGGKVGPVNTC